MITYVFPGQGSQKKGMGKELFDNYPDLVHKVDEILGYSIKTLCLEDPFEQLKSTKYTQPAIYVVNALNYLEYIDRIGQKPDYLLGHSLGEYSALFAADIVDFETGLKIVKERGRLMSEITGGGMGVILGIGAELVQNILIQSPYKSIQIANYNTKQQTVISGKKEEIMEIKELFLRHKDVRFLVLNVSGAFHSKHMQKPKESFESFLDTIKLKKGHTPVISNVTAREYEGDDIRTYLAKQMTSSIRWQESIEYLISKGCTKFIEIGDSRILTNMINKIKEQYDRRKPIKVHNPEEKVIENAEQTLSASILGSKEFREAYGLKYAYVAGAMYRGISSKELVIKLGNAGLLAYFGVGGLKLNDIRQNIQYIKRNINQGKQYGVNLIASIANPDYEEALVNLYLEEGVKNIEASAFMYITKALVKFRAKGLHKVKNKTVSEHKIMAKISRPEIAEGFMRPAPEKIVVQLLEDNQITKEQAELLKEVPMADDICAESDSGGHTDQGVSYVLLPTILRMRDRLMKHYNYNKMIHVGSAGGIGTPEAACAAFILGADFIVTGSINQCTVEASTSEVVKDILESINIYDTDYSPAGDMFELGAKVQVLKKGVFFPARAQKLYDIYKHYNSLEKIPIKLKEQLENRYFKKSFESIFDELKESYKDRDVIKKAEENPKLKMLMIFKWYYRKATDYALEGSIEHKIDYQIQCGPALGAFNQWVKGTDYEHWRNRHVDKIAYLLMEKTVDLLITKMRHYKIS